jgi:arylsulfatase A
MNTSSLIRYTITSASLFIISGGQVVALEQDKQQSRRPNIIFILADDLGYSELGCYGNTFNETPHLDRLAEEGVLFTQSYAAGPLCSPYRAALMTGQYPARTGITDYLLPNSELFLDTNLVTLAKALKQNGYHTGMTGKWHLSGYASRGASVEVLPGKHGFDKVMSSEITGIAACSFFYPYHFNTTLEKKLDTEHEFLVDRMNLEAIEFIEENHDKPFFLYVSHYAVHIMLHGKPDLVDHFRSKPESGSSSAADRNPLNDPYTKWPADYLANSNNPHLAAQLWSIDEGVGMIREKLRELGIEEHTILIFTSDNGGERRVTTNSPLREGKATLYEGGIRVPFIAYQPGKIAGGLVIDTPIQIMTCIPPSWN